MNRSPEGDLYNALIHALKDVDGISLLESDGPFLCAIYNVLSEGEQVPVEVVVRRYKADPLTEYVIRSRGDEDQDEYELKLEVTLIASVVNAARGGDSKAAMWLLANRFPERWA